MQRVLLIEDCADLADVTADLLTSYGFEVRTALSGHDALDVAATFQPQLVLCDLNLPDMNGLDLAHELRMRPSTAGSRIVIVSATQGTSLAETGATSSDIDAVLSKPIMMDALEKLLER